MKVSVSVITVCYNEADVVADAITSVLEQNYEGIEYVVIDGGSSDGTRDVIMRYQEKIGTIISEPDRGIYDAMNKGLDIATGDLVYFLNADDRFYDRDVVRNAVLAFEAQPDTEILSGRLQFVNVPEEKKDIERNFRFSSKSDLFYQPNPQQCLFCRRSLFDRVGKFNLRYPMCADYEWLLRAIDSEARIQFTDSIFAYFDYQGISYTQNKQRKREKNRIILLNSNLKELVSYVTGGLMERLKAG